MGCVGIAASPWWAGRPPLGPMHLGLGGETLRGAHPLCLGGKSPLPGRRPPSRSHLEGPAPLAPSPINRGVRGGLQHHKLRRSPSPPQHLSSSVRARRSPVGVLLHQQHHAVVLPLELSSSTSPSSLLDQDGGDVVRPVRVLNAEVLSVQHLDIGDLNHVEYDSIITVPSNASARDLQVVCRCKLTPLTRCLDELIDGSW